MSKNTHIMHMQGYDIAIYASRCGGVIHSFLPPPFILRMGS